MRISVIKQKGPLGPFFYVCVIASERSECGNLFPCRREVATGFAFATTVVVPRLDRGIQNIKLSLRTSETSVAIFSL